MLYLASILQEYAESAGKVPHGWGLGEGVSQLGHGTNFFSGSEFAGHQVDGKRVTHLTMNS